MMASVSLGCGADAWSVEFSSTPLMENSLRLIHSRLLIYAGRGISYLIKIPGVLINSQGCGVSSGWRGENSTPPHTTSDLAGRPQAACNHRHPFDEANTYRYTDHRGYKFRQRRRCKADRKRAQQQRMGPRHMTERRIESEPDRDMNDLAAALEQGGAYRAPTDKGGRGAIGDEARSG